MRISRIALWGCAVVALAAEAAPARAAWDNVFQVSCFGKHRQTTAYYVAPTTAYYQAPTTCCAPQPCCPQYVQRSYYQPVQTYETRTYYEPVTSYKTSYYYEPVTSYRYSNYYDPCTCSCQQVAVPTTSYQLKAQSCPVQSWVQRCATVPVTAYKQAFYWDPVSTCAPPATVSSYSPTCCNNTALPVYSTSPPPAAGVIDYPSRTNTDGSSNRFYPKSLETMPGASFRPVQPANPAPQQNAPSTSPGVRLDRIVSIPSTNIEGQVVRKDETPWSGAKVTFVNANQKGQQQNLSADEKGIFKVALNPGSWLVYIEGSEGKPVFHRKIEVTGAAVSPASLASR